MRKKKTQNPNTYTPLERNMYLTGLFGQNMIFNIIGVGLTYYLQSVIFVPAMATAIIFAIARVWDAINDPMMGTIVDRTRSKWGKCRPYLLFAPVFIGIITILTFVNGTYSSANSAAQNAWIIAWAGISYILWGMLYTVGDIPIWSITALMTEDEQDRSKILAACRIVAGIGGGLVLPLIIPLSQTVGAKLYESGKVDGLVESTKMGFIIIATILTIIATITFQMAGIFTKERVQQSEEHHTMKENFKLMWDNKPFRQILISSVLRAPVMLLMLVAMPLLSYYYGDNGATNYIVYMIVLGGGIFGGQFITTALVPKLCEKYEKKNIYNICSIGSGIPFGLLFVCYLIAPSELHKPLWVAILFVLFTLAGAGQGAVNVLQSVMIADAIDYEEYYHGIRPDGVFFSGQSFATKLSSGIASLLQGLVYAIVGFSGDAVRLVNEQLAAGASFKADPQFAPYRAAMFFCCSIPTMIGMFLSVIPTWKYALSDKEHTRILNELNKRRHNGDVAEKVEIEITDEAVGDVEVLDVEVTETEVVDADAKPSDTE